MEFRIMDGEDVLLSRPMEAMPQAVAVNLGLVVESELSTIRERFDRLSRLKKALTPTVTPAPAESET